MSTGKRLEERMVECGFTKNSLAKRIGIHPSTLNNWIIEKTTPDSLKLEILCEHLLINKQWLLTGEGEMLKTPRNEAVEITNLNIMMVPLVNQYAYGGFLAGYADDTYIEKLPRIPFLADKEYKGNYLSFEVKGDSMNDGTNKSLEEGDIILGREISRQYWKSKLHIRQWDAFIIAHKTEGIIVKQIVDHNVEKGIITCHSYNPFYEDFTLNLEDIVRLYNVVKVLKTL